MLLLLSVRPVRSSDGRGESLKEPKKALPAGFWPFMGVCGVLLTPWSSASVRACSSPLRTCAQVELPAPVRISTLYG